ncbi:MAG TPA: GNAT family N-acetyltransferase [Allosphingosinicella sp.]|nr:GNAT family N-acetyltransferase [Allosphingosinicella sp.]
MNLFLDVRRPDRDAVSRLLVDLDAKYPNGLDWLQRRLDDIEAGRARLCQLMNGAELVALGIQTPKGPHRLKLSTFMVAASSRRAGLGRTLIEAMRRQWLSDEIEQVTVTVDELDRNTVRFFQRHGFVRVPRARARYAAGRADLVLCWRAEHDAGPPRDRVAPLGAIPRLTDPPDR